MTYRPQLPARIRWRARVEIQHLGVNRVMQEIRLCEPEVGIVVDDLHKVFNQIMEHMLCDESVIRTMNRHAWPRVIEAVTLALQAGFRLPWYLSANLNRKESPHE